MKLYNTLTRKPADVAPLDGKTVRIYSCGPTVYDHAHVGNLSAYIFADMVRRTVNAAGFDVKHAMNYTDVDDKTIRRSREKYPDMEPREALHKLTNFYIDLFRDDMAKIGNDTAAIEFVRATDAIEGMQKLITGLHEKGFAYIADDGVYFSIESYRKTGKKYGQLLKLTKKNTSEARIQNDEYDKDSVHDFALWKTQKPGEPAWDFTVGGKNLRGRPGWHIECSVMSRQELGQPFDIHTGGIDLIFPHHENEIAQSTALETSRVMATIFAHNDHILVDGKKMAKSAQNFYTLEDIAKKGYDPIAFRLMMLQGHYSNAVNFTWESLEAAQNRLKGYRAMADLRWQLVSPETNYNYAGANFKLFQEKITTSLENNLDTPHALALLSIVEGASQPPVANTPQAQEFVDFLTFIDHTLGLQLLASEDITDEQKQTLTGRQTARVSKDWEASDKLRDQLLEQGLGVRDTPHGQVWYRV